MNNNQIDQIKKDVGWLIFVEVMLFATLVLLGITSLSLSLKLLCAGFGAHSLLTACRLMFLSKRLNSHVSED